MSILFVFDNEMKYKMNFYPSLDRFYQYWSRTPVGCEGGVTLTLPPAYSGSVCGLCGDFNGYPSDDFVLPDGSLVIIKRHLKAHLVISPCLDSVVNVLLKFLCDIVKQALTCIRSGIHV